MESPYYEMMHDYGSDDKSYISGYIKGYHDGIFKSQAILLKEQPEIVRCKDCGDCRQDGYCERWHISVKPDFFCADGDDGNLQEGT